MIIRISEPNTFFLSLLHVIKNMISPDPTMMNPTGRLSMAEVIYDLSSDWRIRLSHLIGSNHGLSHLIISDWHIGLNISLINCHLFRLNHAISLDGLLWLNHLIGLNFIIWCWMFWRLGIHNLERLQKYLHTLFGSQFLENLYVYM